jgi:hypothetical protein
MRRLYGHVPEVYLFYYLRMSILKKSRKYQLPNSHTITF